MFYYILAIILHDAIDFIAFLKAKDIITSIFVIELIIAIFACLFARYAYILYINFEENNEEKIEENIMHFESSYNNI